MSDHELPSLDWWKQQLCRCYSPRAQWWQSNHFNVDTITIKWHATFDPNAFASLNNNSNKILFIVHHTTNHIHSRDNSGYGLSQRKEPLLRNAPDSKVHGANMGPIWGRHDPGGPHVGPTNYAIWGLLSLTEFISRIVTPLLMGWAHTQNV